MKLKIFKQIAFLLIAGFVGLSIGMTIMWNGHGASAANESKQTADLTDNHDVAVVCQHELKYVPTVNATCGHEGVREHYECEKCHKKFRDAAGKNEVTDGDLRIDNSGIAHDLEYCPAQEPTCTEEGCHEHWHCKNCDQNFHDENGEDIYRNVKIGYKHSLVKVSQVDADCEKTGNIEYYECQICHKKFADEAGKKELTDDEIVIEKLEHEFQCVVPEQPRTCTEDGHPAYCKCVHCHKKFLESDRQTEFDENNLPAEYQHVGHTYEKNYLPESAVYRDYSNPDTFEITFYEVCSKCGDNYGSEYAATAFASLYHGYVGNGNINVTYTSKEVDGHQVVDQDVYTVTQVDENHCATIVINLPATYVEGRSIVKYQNEMINPELDPYNRSARLMILNLDFTETNEVMLEFNFDGEGKIMQTIRIVKGA